MLQLEDVHSYYGESHALQGITLEIAEGEVVCLLGRNGAGKSTTLRSIIGLTPARRGRVLFKGEPIEKLSPNKIARLGIGFVPEDRRIFAGLTVHENLEVSQAPMPESDRKWPLDRIYEEMPMLVEISDRPGDYLSGGQQQMLAVARALVGEPNEGLAPVIVQQIGRMIDELSKTTTILLTEQNIKFALRHAKRGYVIEKGRVVHTGSAEEFISNPETIEKFMTV